MHSTFAVCLQQCEWCDVRFLLYLACLMGVIREWWLKVYFPCSRYRDSDICLLNYSMHSICRRRSEVCVCAYKAIHSYECLWRGRCIETQHDCVPSSLAAPRTSLTAELINHRVPRPEKTAHQEAFLSVGPP